LSHFSSKSWIWPPKYSSKNPKTLSLSASLPTIKRNPKISMIFS